MQCHDIVIIMIQNKGIVNNRTVLRGKLHTGNYNISITVRFPRILKKQQILRDFFHTVEEIITVVIALQIQKINFRMHTDRISHRVARHGRHAPCIK